MSKQDTIISLLKEIDKNIDNVGGGGTNANLKELTITSNGEYVPEEGVDGFSKVTAEFDISSLPKVKTYSFIVDDACINEDGVWKGESFIDTSECRDFVNTFNNVKTIKKLNTTTWDMSKVYRIVKFISGNEKLEEIIGIENWNVISLEEISAMFGSCPKLENLDLRKWNTINVKNMDSFGSSASAATRINIENWNTRNVSNFMRLFYNSRAEWSNAVGISAESATNVNYAFCYMSAKTIVGDYTINDVIEKDLKVFDGLKISLNMTTVSPPNNLNRASLRALINGLADLTGQTAQTLTIGETLIAKLTEEDIAIATAKNWTIA